MPLQNTNLEGTLTIGAVAMQNAFGAWGICGDERGRGGLLHLWTKFMVRGQDRLLPGATGVIAYPRRITATPCDLRLLVVGDIDGQTGAAATDAVETLADNLTYLTTNVTLPVVSSTGTRSCTLTVPGQSNRTANAHILGLEIESYMLMPECQGAIAVTTLKLSIPGGRFS